MKVRYRLLVALACAVYFTSYITRLDFNAALANIVENTAMTKSQAGLIGTALFFSYGFGQVVSGFLGDKVKPQLLILIGFVVTILCNGLFFALFKHYRFGCRMGNKRVCASNVLAAARENFDRLSAARKVSERLFLRICCGAGSDYFNLFTCSAYFGYA